MHICLRCSDSYKDSIVKATGHKYGEPSVNEATCTSDGSRTYKCDNCQKEYTEKILSEGHKWELTESKEATCESAGYKKYICTVCSEIYSEEIEQLMHSFTENTVNATCTENGYTEYKCGSCGYSYKDNFVYATGHNYVAEWTWETDYSAAHAVLTCSNSDCGVTQSIEGEITVKEHEATCAVAGRTDYIATGIFNGDVYNDIKSIEGEKKEHIYSAEWKFDGVNHWHECEVCGEKNDIGKHAFDEGMVIEEANCGYAGEMLYVCPCGAEKTETIPATGEHNFENGVCTVCGKEEIHCDHSELTKTVTINFEDFGCCVGSVVLKTCECGEVVSGNAQDIMIGCNISGETYETAIDEEGKEYLFTEETCPVCGMFFGVKMYRGTDVCDNEFTIYLTVKKDSTTIIDNAELTGNIGSHGRKAVIIEFNEHSACGSRVYAEMCPDCLQIMEVNYLEINCNVGEPIIEKTEDGNGILHTVTTLQCADCGLKFVEDEFEKILSCTTEKYLVTTIFKGDTAVFTHSDIESISNHNFEAVDYTLYGQTCEEGYAIKYVCADCGATYIDKSSTHRERKREVYFEEYGCCEGTGIIYIDCAVCNTVLSLEDMNFGCNIDQNVQPEQSVDENGVTHMTASKVCPDCGFTFISDMTVENVSECISVNGMTVYVLDKTGKSVFEISYFEKQENHEFTYEYNLFGNSCEEGYEVVRTCSKCDYSDSAKSWSHSYNKAEKVLVGSCNVTVSGEICDICGYLGHIENITTECKTEGEETSEYEDENGILHSVTKATCSVCGFTFETDAWTEQWSECIEHTYQKGIIYNKENQEVLSFIQTISSNLKHDYRTIYRLNGETCDDGYTEIRLCTICGEYNETFSKGHHTEGKYFELTADGCCGGKMVVQECVICGNTVNVDYIELICELKESGSEKYTDDNGFEHTVLTEVCGKCGLIKKADTWTEKEDNCIYKNNTKLTIIFNGSVLAEFTQTETSLEHDFVVEYELHGETCEDGYLKITRCKNCDYYDREEMSGHDSENGYIYLQEYGLCEGNLYYEKCGLCGEYLNFKPEFESCAWEETGVNSEGYTVYKCKICGGEKLLKEVRGEKDANCRLKITNIVIYRIDSKEVFKFEYSYFSTEHNFETSYEFKGNSCTDGVKEISTCHDCGYSDYNEYFEHITHSIFKEELGSYGCCEKHYISVSACACGYDFSYDFDKENYALDESTGEYKCSECGLVFSYKEIDNSEGCVHSIEKIFSAKCGDKILVDWNKTVNYIEHLYKSEVQEDGSGNIKIVSTCECGEITEQVLRNAVLSEMEKGYGYDFEFIPESEGVYEIFSVVKGDTCVRLYEDVNGELQEIGYNDDGKNGGNFYLAYKLDAGVRYVYRIQFYSGEMEDGIITFVFGSEIKCNAHGNKINNISVLLPGSLSCEDGWLRIDVCASCGGTIFVDKGSDHGTTDLKTINLGEYGACGGEAYLRGCACGKVKSFDYYTECNTNYTSNQYVGEDGKTYYVEAYTCDNCKLRIQKTYYIEKNGCEIITYYTVNITVGETAVDVIEYESISESHDYEITGSLDDGVSCENGLNLVYKCRSCEKQYEETVYEHLKYIEKSINLSDYGCVCGGYALEKECLCGKVHEIDLSNALCDFGNSDCPIWIENIITGQQYSIKGYTYFNHESYIIKCAVTDPEQCAFAIRYARYYLKAEDECMAYEYETWQFGYNEQTGEFKEEITYKTGESALYHNYVVTEINSTEGGITTTGQKHECTDCGSYYQNTTFRDGQERDAGSEEIISNTLDNGFDKLRHIRNEYIYDERGLQYVSVQNTEIADSEGNETFRFETNEYDFNYTSDFGDYGVAVTNTVESSSENDNLTYEYAYVNYKGYNYNIYEYRTFADYWEKYDYTYDFTDGCSRTVKFTNSYGEDSTHEEDCHQTSHRTEYISVSTCSQFGERKEIDECPVCTLILREETEKYEPNDHMWEFKTESGIYVCSVCGLENENGASGTIVMEDLTEKFGDGTEYVVGYWNKDNVMFTKYVSLILDEPLEDGNTEVILSDITFKELSDGLIAVSFNKAEAEAQAATKLAELGYNGTYSIRFAFVPEGSDGSFDYAITFSSLM